MRFVYPITSVLLVKGGGEEELKFEGDWGEFNRDGYVQWFRDESSDVKVVVEGTHILWYWWNPLIDDLLVFEAPSFKCKFFFKL